MPRWIALTSILPVLFLLSCRQPPGSPDKRIRREYYELADIEKGIRALAREHSTIVKSESLKPKSVEGRDIFAVKITDNSFGQLILYPYSSYADKVVDAKVIELAEGMAKAIESVHQHAYKTENGSELYRAFGTSKDYVYDTYGIPAYTVEVRPTSSSKFHFFPPPELIEPTFEEQFAGLRHMLENTPKSD